MKMVNHLLNYGRIEFHLVVTHVLCVRQLPLILLNRVLNRNGTGH